MACERRLHGDLLGQAFFGLRSLIVEGREHREGALELCERLVYMNYHVQYHAEIHYM